jgi:hypothetical protein
MTKKKTGWNLFHRSFWKQLLEALRMEQENIQVVIGQPESVSIGAVFTAGSFAISMLGHGVKITTPSQETITLIMPAACYPFSLRTSQDSMAMTIELMSE